MGEDWQFRPKPRWNTPQLCSWAAYPELLKATHYKPRQQDSHSKGVSLIVRKICSLKMFDVGSCCWLTNYFSDQKHQSISSKDSTNWYERRQITIFLKYIQAFWFTFKIIMFIIRWMDKENVVYKHIRTLLRHKNPVICSKM